MGGPGRITAMEKAKVGDTIRINYMDGEPEYSGKVGKITRIDDIGQMHGTWGGLAVIESDNYTIIEKGAGNGLH